MRQGNIRNTDAAKRIRFLGMAICGILLWYGGRAMAAVTTGSTYIEAKKVAITFDDGPNPEYTERLLDGLKERNVTATFFLIGSEVKEYPEIVKRMSREGHLIGNHTYEHVNLCETDREQVKWQVEQTNDLIYEITGKRPVYIRPPYGSWSAELGDVTGMLEILWTVDPRDWDCDDTGELIERVLNAVTDDSVILFHDSSASSVDAALSIIDILTERGYEFVCADEILYN
jgi:peptidoglycan/xylan/chitin deacetylase (PgdA/CDA1 family)